MIKPVFAIRDVKTCFMTPFVDETIQSAVRGFQYSLVNQPGIIGFAPTDFSLYQIADYDSSTGELIPLNPVKFICNAEVKSNEA